MRWPEDANELQRRWRLACRVLGLAALATVIGISVVAYLGELPPWLPNVGGIDKVGHFLLFGGVVFFADGAFAYRRLGRTISWPRFAPLLVWVPTAIEEWAQRFSPHRSSDIADLAADTAGMVLASWLSAAIDRRLARRGT